MFSQPFPAPSTLNCNGRALSIKDPIVMGVINITTDSFYKASRVMDENEILEKARDMISEGADILDVGAMSSRPGAELLPAEVELDRMVMACSILRSKFPNALLSIDTFRLSVLEALLPYRIHLINDITAGKENEDIWAFAAQHHLPYVLMHMKGDPSTMANLNQYEDLIAEILDFFIKRVPKIIQAGVKDIILDPGIGFAKNIEQNFYLLRHLHLFRLLEFPILIGLSRKSMIWKTLGISPEEALNGTTALHMHALNQGAAILRVHDVKAARETIQLWKKLNQPITQ